MAQGRVYKRGKTWTYTIDLAPGPDGARRQKTKGGFATRKLADEAKNIVLSEVARGTYVDPSRITLADYLIDEWLPAKRLMVIENSLASYTDTVRRYVVPALGATRLDQLQPQRIERAYAALMESGGHNGRGLSPSTVAYVHRRAPHGPGRRRAMGPALHQPRQAGQDPDRPGPTKRAERWSADELATFLTAQEGDPDPPPLVAAARAPASAAARPSGSTGPTWT